MLIQQNWICPLCNKEIFHGEDTLDHDHKTGHVRGVLHRSCNQAEGKILSWCNRTNAEFPQDLLFGILAYWSGKYSENPIHPNHLTEDEKLIKKYRKIKKKSKRPRTKKKYEDLIQTLTKEIQKRSEP